MSAVDRVTEAWALFVCGRKPADLRARLRAGMSPVEAAASDSASVELGAIRADATTLASQGVDAVVLGSSMYPTTLASLRNAPIALFTKGNSELLHAPGVGMCGSRNASPRGLSAAAGCGEEVAGQRLAIVSGYAKGVDTETHLAALRTGGSTVIVLAEGIGGFRQKRAFDEVGLDPDRVLVVSQFPPTQRWTAGAAMTRNGVIAGLGLALVVIEAGEKGGTLNAGSQALRMQRPVLALEFESMDTPAGNQLLIRDGAMPVRSRADLRRALEVLRGRPMGEASEQLAFLRD